MPAKRVIIVRYASFGRLLAGWAMLLAFVATANLSAAFDPSAFGRAIASITSSRAIATIKAWSRLVADSGNLPELEKLRTVNDFFNRNIQFEDDQKIWSQADYWATPVEVLSMGAGDCEDFSIAKYFTLKTIGIAQSQLRLIYVKALIGGRAGGPSQAHMVLAYYATPDSEPLVLDNLISDIRPASRRTDLTPVFSFNGDGIWAGTGTTQAGADTSRLSRWRDLLMRARAEGFD